VGKVENEAFRSTKGQCGGDTDMLLERRFENAVNHGISGAAAR